MKKIWNKYTRALAIIFVAIVFTGVALYMNKSFVDARVNTKTVLVPKEHLKPFSPLKDNLTTRDVVVSEIPSDAIISEKDLEGKDWYVGDIGLIKGTPIRKSLITNEKTNPFGQAITLKEGRKLIGVTTDLPRSSGDYLKAGVLVDAYVYIKGDQQRRAQMVTPEDNSNLKGLLVKDHKNQEGTTTGEKEGKSLVPNVAVLEVSSAAARDLVQYQEEGKIYLLPSGVDKEYIDNFLKENVNKKQLINTADPTKSLTN